jgi:hypothetical protein
MDNRILENKIIEILKSSSKSVTTKDYKDLNRIIDNPDFDIHYINHKGNNILLELLEQIIEKEEVNDDEINKFIHIFNYLIDLGADLYYVNPENGMSVFWMVWRFGHRFEDIENATVFSEKILKLDPEHVNLSPPSSLSSTSSSTPSPIISLSQLQLHVDFIIPIPKITDSNSHVDYFNMFVLFEEVNGMIYKKWKVKKLFLKKIGYNLFSLKYENTYNEDKPSIIYFSLQDNKIYFQMKKYNITLFYAFLIITSKIENYKCYVYIFDNLFDNSLDIGDLNLFLKKINTFLFSPILSIIEKDNKSFLNFLIKNNKIFKKDIDNSNSIYLTTNGNNVISNNKSNIYDIDNIKDIDFKSIYESDLLDGYFKKIYFYFYSKDIHLDLFDELMKTLKCSNSLKKRKPIIDRTMKHKPLSYDIKRKSLDDFTRKKRKKYTSSNTPIHKMSHTFNNENINIGLLIITAHGGIPVNVSASNEITIPLKRLPVRNTKLYYKNITIPGYNNLLNRLTKINPASYNSEENDYEFHGDSVGTTDINSQPEKIVYPISLRHYRNIIEKCFKKTPLNFENLFYSCGNKIIKKNYENLTKSLVREQDKKDIDLSKLNKTIKGPIDTIIDKILSIENELDNAKIIFMVFNNSTKTFKRYDLMDEKVIKRLFFHNEELATKLLSQMSKKRMMLSLLVKLALTYSYDSIGLESLYVYDVSCHYYMDTALKTSTLDEIDEIIQNLPPNIGR